MRKVFFLCVPCVVALQLSTTRLKAGTTNFTEDFPSGHGWTWTQETCSVGGTCTNGDVSGDGNPAPSVFVKIVGRNKKHLGRWGRSFTWEQLGVPAGDTVDTVDGSFDVKLFQETHSATQAAGMKIYDAADSTACTDADVEADIDPASSSWTTINNSGAVNVLAGCSASNTTVTLRLRMDVNSGNNNSATTEVRCDTFKLTITSTTPSGRNRVVVISRRF